MKINKYIIHLSIAGSLLLGTSIFQSCMDDELNRPDGKISEEELNRDGYAANAFFPTMCDYAYPVATENIYNTMESLIGDCYGRYQVLATDKFKGANFISYNAPGDWLDQPFKDGNVMVKISTAWSKIKEVTGGTGVNFAWAQILRITAMQRLVDLYGAIPYSKMESGNLNSPYDTQEEAYRAMFKDLTNAINDMTLFVNQHPEEKPMKKFDNIYEGDFRKWVKYANSLKLRMAVRVRFAAPDLAEQMATEAVNHPIGVIVNNEDNAASSGNKNQLWTVLVDWSDHCVCADITSYMNGYQDPRRSKYFTKKTISTGSEEYVGMRSGISYNRSDRLGFSLINVQREDRTLWMSAAETAFNKAEGAMRHWDMKGKEKDLYEEGIRLSFQQWGVNGIESYLEGTTSQSAYTDPQGSGSTGAVSTITVKWNDGDNEEVKLERIITQKWIALWPLGQEAWSEYRRTGYPKLFPIAPGISPNIPVANRIPFPTTEFTRNTENVNEAVQKLGGNGYDTKIWWQRTDK